ncbi:MAG: redoxin domain-containing protein [Acidobacteria bacterium]|nr:redoxin domain-containing protein [Acidobacteriota bacterium]
MKRLLITLFGISILALASYAQPPTAQPTPVATPRPTPAPLALKVGDMAPDFTLPATDGTKVKLSDFRGKSNVVLAFYVLAFTGG